MKNILIMTLIISSSLVSFLVVSLARAEDGVSEKEILIGESTNFKLARPKSVHAGAELFFNKLNTSGGVNGRKFKMIILEDNYMSKKDFANITTLH